ncbi:hypothetical protein [Pseudomonas sp. LRF_L74]|uniref:hypothetical protein n=1 Tax=Pseudomonas sp. LRF_L74 TaxID=3369422 RepID=UPI003F613B64
MPIGQMQVIVAHTGLTNEVQGDSVWQGTRGRSDMHLWEGVHTNGGSEAIADVRYSSVIPAKAGTQKRFFIWAPACAGVTAKHTE